MKVTVVAHTEVNYDAIYGITKGTAFGNGVADEWYEPGAHHLVEFAGRTCYLAYERKNAATATPRSYIGHIIDQGHFSVLEHATVSFHVEGVSRSLLLELERHRFLSFSVESQRYVDQSHHTAPVIPAALAGTKHETYLLATYGIAIQEYNRTVEDLVAKGVDRKTARGAARAFLPECTPTTFVVSGNLRCWRDVISKRYHEAADAEIREFATLVLELLQRLAPAAFQDITKVGSYGN